MTASPKTGANTLTGEGLAAALHTSSGKPVTPADPAAPGEVISLFLTGLGATRAGSDGLAVALEQPLVRIADRPCDVLYAGRAPALPGVDQINCRLAPELDGKAGAVRVHVISGNRTGAADLAVR